MHFTEFKQETEIMINLNRSITFFCRLQNLLINNVNKHAHDYQYTISDSLNMVYITIYDNKNILVQGKESELKQLFLWWANKKHSIPLARGLIGQANFSLEWREWKGDSYILQDYFKSQKISNISLPDNLLFNRDRMFHDYMFRNKMFCTMKLKKSIELIKSWFDKNCFENIPEDAFFYEFHKYISSLYKENSEDIELVNIADALSYAMAIHCSKKMIICKKCRGCPQMGNNNTACLFNLIDSLYPYTNANQIVAFNQSNLNILVGKKRGDVSWHNIIPSSPIEEIMGSKLKDANFPIIPQFQAYSNVHKYRIDFLLETNSMYKIGVECDGLEFHARKEQYEKDRERDRYLQMHNIFIMRFSSREIFNKIDECIKEIDIQFWKIKKENFDIRIPYRTSYFHLNENNA